MVARRVPVVLARLVGLAASLQGAPEFCPEALARKEGMAVLAGWAVRVVEVRASALSTTAKPQP